MKMKAQGSKKGIDLKVADFCRYMFAIIIGSIWLLSALLVLVTAGCLFLYYLSNYITTSYGMLSLGVGKG